MPVVTVARQFGAGGDEIAERVASNLGLRLVNSEIIDDVGQRLGLSPEIASERDESDENLVVELVRAMQRLYPAILPRNQGPDRPPIDERAYLQVIQQVVTEAARTGDAVIVGRGSSFILKEQPHILNVLVLAPLDLRIKRVMESEHLERRLALQRLNRVDASRTRYIQHFYRANWLAAAHYDLALNTGHFSFDQAAALICNAVQSQDGVEPESGDRVPESGDDAPLDRGEPA